MLLCFAGYKMRFDFKQALISYTLIALPAPLV